MAKSGTVESPATEARMRANNVKRRIARYRFWATLIEKGQGATVAKALRNMADYLERK
jgi:hypothetical protein